MQDYEITRDGRIISHKFGRCREKKIQFTKDGYCKIMFSNKSKQTSHLIHRLVADEFIPNPLNLPKINHKDGNKLNNNDWNLERCTHKHNMQHAGRTKLIKQIGEQNNNCKLLHTDVIKIIEFGKTMCGTRIADLYNISTSQVYSILNGRSWKHIKH